MQRAPYDLELSRGKTGKSLDTLRLDLGNWWKLVGELELKLFQVIWIPPDFNNSPRAVIEDASSQAQLSSEMPNGWSKPDSLDTTLIADS